MATNGKLYLYDSDTCEQYAEVEQEGLDVFFPADVRGWSDVLDCRIAPYDGKSLEENCHYAAHVRKFYILVTEQQVEQSTPPKEAAD